MSNLPRVDCSEEEALEWLKGDGNRLVKNSKRARKLRKRGEEIKWNYYFQCWVWSFKPGGETE